MLTFPSTISGDLASTFAVYQGGHGKRAARGQPDMAAAPTSQPATAPAADAALDQRCFRLMADLAEDDGSQDPEPRPDGRAIFPRPDRRGRSRASTPRRRWPPTRPRAPSATRCSAAAATRCRPAAATSARSARRSPRPRAGRSPDRSRHHPPQRLDRVGLGGRLVGADPRDAREAHGEARFVALAGGGSNRRRLRAPASSRPRGPGRSAAIVWLRTKRSSHFSSSSVKPK